MGMPDWNAPNVSILTQCPICHTVFRVDVRGLAPSLGHAKCGVCGMVFNAVESHQPEIRIQPKSLSHTPRYQVKLDADLTWMGTPFADQVHAHASHDDSPTTVMVEAAPAPMPAAPSAPSPAATAELETPTFKPLRHSHAGWIAALNLLLVFALATQLVVFYRNPLSARVPLLAPVLSALCQLNLCRIELPRDIDAVKIVSSEFNSDAQDPTLLHVQLSIGSTADYPLAFPAISLTLENDSGELIARKTIYPEDYLEMPETLASGLPAQGEWPLAVTLNTGKNNISNYKLQLFYPPKR